MKKVLMLLLLITACRPAKEFVSNETVKDSTHTKVTYIPKDTTVVIPADSVMIRKLISELSEKPVVKKSNRATLSIKKVGRHIQAECKTEELEQIIALKSKIIEIYESREKTTKETITIPVKYVPKLISTLAWIGGGTLLLLGTGIVLRTKKLI